MAPSKNNSKKEAGNAKKAENENVKKGKAAAQKEQAEAKDWEDGAKSNAKADAARLKLLETERKKAEKAALLAAEEASLPSKPKVSGVASKKKKPAAAVRPAGPGAIAAGGGLGGAGGEEEVDDAPKGVAPAEFRDEPVVHLGATGVDAIIDALEVVNVKSDKSSLGAKAGLIEKHPERRFKAALEAYIERELPQYKEDYPGLRKQQYHDRLFKLFEKSPDNPFNQVLVAHNASKEERVEALKGALGARERGMAVKEGGGDL